LHPSNTSNEGKDGCFFFMGVKERNRRYYLVHRQEILKRHQERRQELNNYQRQWQADHKVERAEYDKQYRKRVKHEVLNHYSLLHGMTNPDGSEITPCCGCCQESNLDLLEIDHIEGNGNEHRTQLGISTSTGFYLWLKKQDYPFGYQTLCKDCNLRKQFWDGERNTRPVNQYDLTGNLIATYGSQIEAAKCVGVDAKNISSVCRGRKYYKTAGGYKWQYAN